jgi:hypothetical protein
MGMAQPPRPARFKVRSCVEHDARLVRETAGSVSRWVALLSTGGASFVSAGAQGFIFLPNLTARQQLEHLAQDQPLPSKIAFTTSGVRVELSVPERSHVHAQRGRRSRRSSPRQQRPPSKRRQLP